MQKHVVIAVDWFGPYDRASAKEAAKTDYENGLYLLIGKAKHQKTSKLQYIGIASQLYQRLAGPHPIIDKISQELQIWLGEVASFGIPGRRPKVTDPMLDISEWLHSYFLDLPCNSKKKNPPRIPATLVNRWWFKGFNYERRRKKRPHKEWPDLIDFSGRKYGARVVWFGGDVINWNPCDF
jgi:hypothetical protein